MEQFRDILPRFADGSVLMTRRLRSVSKLFLESLELPQLMDHNGNSITLQRAITSVTLTRDYKIECISEDIYVRLRVDDLLPGWPYVVKNPADYEDVFGESAPQLMLYKIVHVENDSRHTLPCELLNGRTSSFHQIGKNTIKIERDIITINIGAEYKITYSRMQNISFAGIVIHDRYCSHIWTGGRIAVRFLASAFGVNMYVKLGR